MAYRTQRRVYMHPGCCASLAICFPHLHGAKYVELKGTALCTVGVKASQLNIPSMTPLSAAGCGRLQLGAPNWATSLSSVQVVDD